MIIIFEIKGKQYQYISTKQNLTFRIPYQKDLKNGDEITFDKILSKDEEFGQPYLKNIKLTGKVIKHGQNKKINVMKYKPKKRNSKEQGFREQYTEVGEIQVV